MRGCSTFLFHEKAYLKNILSVNLQRIKFFSPKGLFQKAIRSSACITGGIYITSGSHKMSMDYPDFSSIRSPKFASPQEQMQISPFPLHLLLLILTLLPSYKTHLVVSLTKERNYISVLPNPPPQKKNCHLPGEWASRAGNRIVF